MKVLDLLFEYTFPEPKVKVISKERLPDLDRQSARDKNIKPISTDPLKQGYFSKVFHNPVRSPHDVRKISQLQHIEDIDGFYFYMRELYHHSDNSNPYFPRFREITLYTIPGSGKQTSKEIAYSVKMERLYHLDQLSEEETNALGTKIYGPSDRTYILTNIIDTVIQLIHDNAQTKSKVVDKHLIAATKFIMRVSKKHNLEIDIHDGNIMVRRTPYGPQLVITDPLSFQN